eukprot:scaffold3089_cov136-Isochrysis_galbana.AAC.7
MRPFPALLLWQRTRATESELTTALLQAMLGPCSRVKESSPTSTAFSDVSNERTASCCALAEPKTYDARARRCIAYRGADGCESTAVSSGVTSE